MTNWRHSAASPPCGSLVCARFIQLDRADAEHWQFPDREPKGRCPGKGTVRSSCVASLGNYSDRIRVRARESHIRSPCLGSPGQINTFGAINFADLGSAKTGSESTHTQGGEQRRSV